jgi:lysophospholipase L1-like esterase
MTMLCLAAAEGVFRLTQDHRDYEFWRRASLRYDYDPHFHWKIRPGFYIHKKSGRLECINSMGLRCPEIAKDKAPGSVRVIALGGSSTYIVSPLTGKSWTDLLAEKLSARAGLPFEVVNAGTPGYSAYQSAMRLKYELINYHPDIVLIYNLSNDMKLFAMDDPETMLKRWDAHGKANAEYTLLNPNPVLDFLCRYSQIVTHLRFKFIKLRLKKVEAGEEGWLYHSLDLKVTPQGIAFYRQNLQNLIDILQPRGIPLVIIEQATLVGPDNTAEEKEEINYKYFGFTHEEMLEAYRQGWAVNEELARESGVYVVRDSASIPHTLEYFDDEVHLTDKGRETLAEIIARDLAGFFGDFRRFAAPGPGPGTGREP